MNTLALGHVAMILQYCDSLFKLLLLGLRKTLVFFKSLLKNTKKHKEHDLFSPDQPTKQRRTYNFINNANYT